MNDKEHEGVPKKFEGVELLELDLLDKDPAQALQDLLTVMNADKSILDKHLHEMAVVLSEKLGSVSIEVNRHINRSLDMCKTLLVRQKRKVFCITLLRVMKSGFSIITFGDSKHGQSQLTIDVKKFRGHAAYLVESERCYLLRAPETV